jgi:two-component system catabolic regulation response regulator CreB
LRYKFAAIYWWSAGAGNIRERAMAPKILVVEDEPAVADTLTYALSTDGFTPVWCSTGREGLAALAKGDVDLVVLDVGLPDANGFELCKEIRKRSRVPVIFLTARAAEVDRVVGLEIGADDYLVKPFSPRELTARVKAVLRRAGGGEGDSPGARKGARNAKAATGPLPPPFVIDEDRCAILYFGAPLPLSRTEYRLLQVLVRRPGWVFSREKLMEMAWDAPDCSLERTVDAHVKSLRAKLRAVRPDADPIRTHRGTGYSLKEAW